jgi:hypothetical protein
MKPMELVEKNIKSKEYWSNKMNKYLICIKNTDYEVSLELRKLYKLVVGSEFLPKDYVRVIDETGDDYLYPADYFIPVEIPVMFEKKMEEVE